MEFTLDSHSWYALCILITCFPPCFSSEWVWHSCLLWRQKEIIPLCFVLTQAVTPECGTGAGTCRAWWIFMYQKLELICQQQNRQQTFPNKPQRAALGLGAAGIGCVWHRAAPSPHRDPPPTPSQRWALAPDTDGNLGRRSSDLRSTSSREPKIAGRS